MIYILITWNLLTLQKMLDILTVCNSYLCSTKHEIILNNMETESPPE